MKLKCNAIVSVTIEVPVDDLHAHWSMLEVHNEAKRVATLRAEEVCGTLGRVATVKVVAVTSEKEEPKP